MRYLPLIHVPLKLSGDNEPESHSDREMPDVPSVVDAEEPGLPVKRTAAAITKASTIMTTRAPASKRRRYRCLFFVIRSCNYYESAIIAGVLPTGARGKIRAHGKVIRIVKKKNSYIAVEESE